ncbi:MAG: hypothetical protein JW751_14250 [Polyangiaceae bacterium]|nr:hypothetical protein [Polyangiaceae bacterium]
MDDAIGRRQALGSLVGLSLTALLVRPSAASTAKALTLDELVTKSHRIVFGTPVTRSSRWEMIAGSRRIVSFTRLVVDEALFGAEDAEAEVKTLGGRIGDRGQIVHGEAELRQGAHTLLFLRENPGKVHVVTGRAQGHYPVRPDDRGIARLAPSPILPSLVDPEAGAVHQLVGRSVDEARVFVREALARRR